LKDMDFLSGKTVLVMGLGRFGGGVDAAKFAAACGADVIVTDLAGPDELAASLAQLKDYPNIEYHLGSHSEEDFEKADIVIANPAVPPDNRFLEIAASCAHLVTSQIAIFFELCPATTIGITGSNGKSTTAALTAHILRNANKGNYGRVWLSGNIGNEPLLMLLNEIAPQDLVVLELSSFQIEQLAAENKAPQVALLTNLSPNHLDRYGTFEKYCAAKELLFANQRPGQAEPPVSIFNREDKIAVELYEKYSNIPERRCLTYGTDDLSDAIRGQFTLPGKCNLSNLAGAVAVAAVFGIDQTDAAVCVGRFKALPHRLQFIIERNGVSWFNDSKATTPQAAVAALEAFDEPVVLIAGGYDKELSFDELAKVITAKTRAVILIGNTAEKIKTAIETVSQGKKATIETCRSLSDAVAEADKTARKGDVVLLSPACASFDMFDNYEQRGSEFIRLVRQLDSASSLTGARETA
jgi:UDP-N-acetylmuramoylalanine--D-glutamate ligase